MILYGRFASKMRMRWKIHYYKPNQICFEILARATKYNPLFLPDNKAFVMQICRKYSQSPDRTFGSLINFHIQNEDLIIIKGEVVNEHEALKQKEKNKWKTLISSGFKSFYYHGDYYKVCVQCDKYEKYAFGDWCVKCAAKNRELYDKECQIKEIKSLINKVKKVCQSQSKQRAI